MTELSSEQAVQEEQYSYPYHYLPRIIDGRFTQSMSWAFGYQYMAAAEFIIERLRELEFESLLDVGCGDGRLIREISSTFPDRRIVGIDYSQRAIAIARSMNPDLDYRIGSIAERSVQDELGTYDAISLIEVLEHIPLDLFRPLWRACILRYPTMALY
ncbi:MAG: class I SAM-dependent methyltransferase [Chloroflexi bacterium]|nr:class I SAM-dependent methyltransferase [Chloroflexota bacterium]